MLETTLSSPYAWRGLDVPHRIALVIERIRLVGGAGVVRDVDFEAAPETCDLDLEVIRANIGKATQILDEESGPTYSRETRILQGQTALASLLPSARQISGNLAMHGFKPDEIKDLWGEIVSGFAAAFGKSFATMPAGTPVDFSMSERTRAELARNAN